MTARPARRRSRFSRGSPILDAMEKSRAVPWSTDGAPPADALAILREREHALRNELFALTLRTDRASEEVAQRRDELNRRLALVQKLLAGSEALREVLHRRERQVPR